MYDFEIEKLILNSSQDIKARTWLVYAIIKSEFNSNTFL